MNRESHHRQGLGLEANGIRGQLMNLVIYI